MIPDDLDDVREKQMRLLSQSSPVAKYVVEGKRPSVCLVHTPCLDLQDDRLEPPLGLLYIATTLQTKGYPVKIVDLASELSPNLERLIPDGYDVYGFSTYSVNYNQTHQLASAIRQRQPTALLIAGGPHATALPLQVANDVFDVVVTGEGELAMLEILEHLEQGIKLPPHFGR